VIKGEITNAFALPGGRIVVYTGILDKIKSYPELAALLSHEFTHINNKHTTKSLFRRLGSKVFLGLLFGRVSAVTGVVVDNADNLRSLKYSRRLEKEADIEGLNLLLKRQIDPAGFEQLFIHLKDSAPTNALPEFLGSHPDVNKRIRYINEASGMPLIKEHTELKTIFEKLNNWQ
jgi:predicted Zn-dependent protease